MNFYWDLQKTRIGFGNRLRAIETNGESNSTEKFKGIDSRVANTLLSYQTEIQNIEAEVAKEIKREIDQHPLWAYWLKDVKGIGHVFAAQLIHLITGKQHTPECQEKRAKYFAKKKPGEKRERAFTCDCPIMTIERFSNVSKLWHYAGLHVVDGKAARRKRGQKVDWNPKLKSLCWQIGKSFVIHKTSEYRKYYDEFKKQEKTKHPELRKGHIDARARRKTVKLFLAHLFDQWYRLKGLEPPKPYAIGILEHSNEIKPSAT